MFCVVNKIYLGLRMITLYLPMMDFGWAHFVIVFFFSLKLLKFIIEQKNLVKWNEKHEMHRLFL